MFDEIFTYSDVDRKYNKISGVGTTVLRLLFLFPLFGMICNVVSCYFVYITPQNYKILFYIFSGVMIVLLISSVIRWVNEMFTVYAIDKNGRVYRFKMIAFALEYLGIGEKTREAANMASTGRTGRFMATYQMIMKMRETIMKLQKESQLEEMIMQGCAHELKFETAIRKNNGIKCKTDAGTFTIRNVYSDSENLTGYIEYYCENGCDTSCYKSYTKIKKTTLEQLITKKGYFKRVVSKTLWITGIFLWLALIMYSGSFGKQAKVNHGIQVKGEHIESTKSYVNVKPLAIIWGVCELVVVLGCLDFEEIKNKK